MVVHSALRITVDTAKMETTHQIELRFRVVIRPLQAAVTIRHAAQRNNPESENGTTNRKSPPPKIA